MEWFWPEGFYTIVMVGVFAVASFAFKQPIAVALAIAAIIGALVSGNGVPIAHLIEGSFGYLDTILIIFCAMIFMKTVQHIGLMESVAAWMIRKFRVLPFRLLQTKGSNAQAAPVLCNMRAGGLRAAQEFNPGQHACAVPDRRRSVTA